VTRTSEGKGAGRRVFITGAGAGIGAATARLLAERGWRIALLDRDGARRRSALRRPSATTRCAAREAIGADLRGRARGGRAHHVASGGRRRCRRDRARGARQTLCRSQRFREVRYLERGGRRVVMGWGEALDAERDQLGRVAAKSPPAVLEAGI
jgi:2-polyprenyl-6-methoxyphenol hydroxylase-like FAD-dependent oxidoreductase